MSEFDCQFRELLASVRPLRLHGDQRTTISSVCYDSREVQAGSLFVALRLATATVTTISLKHATVAPPPRSSRIGQRQSKRLTAPHSLKTHARAWLRSPVSSIEIPVATSASLV